jgi:hypothetical protein
VRGAHVRAREVNGRDNRLVTTDEEGRFEVRDLFAGEWRVAVTKSGFITQQFGQRRPFDASDVIKLADRQRFTADFSLTRAGAITGRVYDEYGEPILAARVQALRSRMLHGIRRPIPTGAGDLTDDTGAFRLYGLGPGEYYVAANLRIAPAEDPTVDATLGVTTYYPGTPSFAEAQRVVLRSGEEQSNISFQLLPICAVRISGVVLNAAGAPAPDVEISLLSTRDVNVVGLPVGNFGRSGPDGTFTIVNVPPGSYVLAAFSKGGNLLDVQEGQVPVTAGTDDMVGLSVTMSKGGRVVGTVVAEPGTAFPPSLSMQVKARSTSRVIGVEMTSGSSAPTRSFQLDALFGPMSFELDGLPDTLMVRAIEIDGTDVTDRPVDLRGRTANAQIVLTNRVTEVTGMVTSRGGPVADAYVVMFPDDRTRWGYASRYVRAARTNAQGRFAVRKLPPDPRYLAAAVEYLEEGEFADPEFLERMRSRAAEVALGDGERKSVNLTLSDRD